LFLLQECHRERQALYQEVFFLSSLGSAPLVLPAVPYFMNRHLGIDSQSKKKSTPSSHVVALRLFNQIKTEENLELNRLARAPWPGGEGVNIDPASKMLRLKVVHKILSFGRPFDVADEFREEIEGDGTRGYNLSDLPLSSQF
jgi:hypothetical protein